MSLDAHRAPAGDIYFDLAPLADGEELTVAALVGNDRLTLHAARASDGYDLGLDTGRLRPRAVTVSYLSDDQLVADPIAVADDDLVEAGTAGDEPTSQHWEIVDGVMVLVYDFTSTETGATTLTTADGHEIEVTHVAFTLEGLDVPTPRAIEFAAPRAVTIRSRRIGEPLATPFRALRRAAHP